jgi:hypothetical protein
VNSNVYGLDRHLEVLADRAGLLPTVKNYYAGKQIAPRRKFDRELQPQLEV